MLINLIYFTSIFMPIKFMHLLNYLKLKKINRKIYFHFYQYLTLKMKIL